MKIKFRDLGWLAAGGFALVVIACSPQEGAAASPRPAATATPNIPATEAARGPAALLRTATPTPVPPQVSQVTTDFAARHRTINQDWDKFHRDFDAWREGLSSCDASSVQVALRQFAGRYAAITGAAQGLPRSTAVRGLSDQLIKAAEGEEQALGLLRDTWQSGQAAAAAAPSSKTNVKGENGDSSSGSDSKGQPTGFEAVDKARSAASALQQEVSDKLADLQKKTAPASQTQVNSFDTAFRAAKSSWDQFHQDYDTFRSGEGRRTSAETVEQLGRLVDQLRLVVLTVRELPAFPTTDAVSKLLAKAAEEEDLALRKLRGTFQVPEKKAEKGAGKEPTGEKPAGKQPAGEKGAGKEPAGGSADSSNEAASLDSAQFVASDRTLFDAFDAALVKANGTRRQAQQDLALVLEEVSKEGQVAVEEFANQHGRLIQQWTAFHRDYDNWRSTEGGCDRAKAITTLGVFTLRFADLGASVRGLPRATVLRPLGEVLVEAAEKEEEALRELRNSWRPFDAQVFQNLDQQRNTGGKLRRQASLGIQELLERYNLTLPAS